MNTFNYSKSLFMKNLFLLAALSVLFIACNDDDDNPVTPPNEEEVITTVILTFTDTAGVSIPLVYQFRDPDGEGGMDPIQFDTIRLAENRYYNVSVTLLNESETPPEDKTQEILDEDDEHLFCYVVSGANLAITRTDSDGTYEVGLQSDWDAGAASNGNTLMTLKHQPGEKDGTCGPGEIDIELDWVVEIQ